MRRLALALFLSVPAAAATLMFRGDPAHSGVYAAVSGQNLIGMQWRFPTGGSVNGSPIVDGDTVYAGSGDGRLYAIDLWTGSQRWSFDAGSPISSTPAITGNSIFFATRDGRLMAVDTATHTARWQHPTGKDQPLPWGHESFDDYIGSPVLIGTLVIFGAGDGNVYALDTATGKVKWTAPTGERIRATPAVANGAVFIGTAGGKVYRFTLASGHREWVYATQGASFASGEFGYDRRTVQSSAAVANGIVYVGARDGKFYAIDESTGTLRWKTDYDLFWVITSPATADGRVYLGSSDGHFVQCLNGQNGNEIWKTDVGTQVWSSPAIAGDLVVAGDNDGHLNAFDRASGRTLWSFSTASAVLSSPFVTHDLVVFGSSDGALYALRVGSGTVKRAVYAHMPSPNDDASKLVKFMSDRGYTALDAASLAAFFNERLSDRTPSVVLFTNARMPDELRPLFRRYLDAGGKIVWIGAPPALVPADPAVLEKLGPKAVDYAAPSELLGVDFSTVGFDARGTRATPAGQRWGLEGRWRSAWGVPVDSVSEVLSRDEWGFTTEWVKSFGGPSGTGFVRGRGTDNNTLYWMSEYRPQNRTP